MIFLTELHPDETQVPDIPEGSIRHFIVPA
jgi:hypothetical protein